MITKYKFMILRDKCNFLTVLLKPLKDRIVLKESGIEFHNSGAVNLHDFRP